MKILLLQDVDDLGLAGEVANVARGYGRNYLMPRKLAIPATGGALKQAENIRKSGEARRAREKADAEAIVGQIGGAVLVFERRASERGQLYGSVTNTDIAEAIQEKFEIEIDRRRIQLSEPIRALGEFNVEIRLMTEVSLAITVAVIQEGTVYAPAIAAESVEAEEALAESKKAEASEEVVRSSV